MKKEKILNDTKMDILHQLIDKVDGVTQNERESLQLLLNDFSDVVSFGPDDLGRTNILKHSINTGDSPPIRQHPRRLPFHQKEVVRGLLNDMIDQEIIEPASGPWSSPIVLVTKKDGSPRFCVDYRKINKVTRKDAHPLPRIDDTLDSVTGSKWFSSSLLLSISFILISVSSSSFSCSSLKHHPEGQ